jgi:hypothetical protein
MNPCSLSTLSPSTLEFLSKLSSQTSPKNSDTQLSEALPPTEYDVVCGRGKGSYNRPGNKRFRAMVCRHLPEYSAAKTKVDKGMVLNAIVEDIRSQNNGTTRFLKSGKNRTWFELTDDQAREKVGHTVREAITALQGEPEKQATKKVFSKKQNDLLAQQRAIFQYLVQGI